MILFDSHCHLYDDKYEDDEELIIKNAHENSVLYMTNIGTDKETSKLVIEQAIKYDGVYAVIGLYPEFCNDDEVDLSFIEQFVAEHNVLHFVVREHSVLHFVVWEHSVLLMANTVRRYTFLIS